MEFRSKNDRINTIIKNNGTKANHYPNENNMPRNQMVTGESNFFVFKIKNISNAIVFRGDETKKVGSETKNIRLKSN